MAYAALVSLELTIADILNNDSYSDFSYRKKRIISMKRNVTLLKGFLEDYPEKVNNILEGRMKDLANHVESFMEHFMCRRIRYDSLTWSAKVKYLFKLYKVAGQVESMAAEVLNIIKKVRLGEDYPAADTSSSRLAPSHKGEAMVGFDDHLLAIKERLDEDHSAADTSSSRLAPSHKGEAMVGFDDHLLAIKERLCGESSKLQVIPIVGMGGIGKTTLATNAYLDPLIVEHFHIRAWVTVSQDYSAQKVTSDLLTLMKELNTEGSSGQSNDLNVYQRLKGRRYLIVIDDIWSRKAWDDINMILPNDNNGSRILLTTRLSDVAAYADSCSPLHEMQLMGMDQSWNLLRQKVFTHEEHCPLELENNGKKIAESCRGLPLAIVVIAGLLTTVSKTRASWEEIAENVKSAINLYLYYI